MFQREDRAPVVADALVALNRQSGFDFGLDVGVSCAGVS
jgi:hypothetical protein